MNTIDFDWGKLVMVDGQMYATNNSAFRMPLMVRTQFDSPLEKEPEFRVRTFMDYGPSALSNRALLYTSCAEDYREPRRNRVHCINLRRRRR